jgi:DNA repair protein RadC
LLELFVKGDLESGSPPVCGPTPNCLVCLLTGECDYFNRPRKPDAAQLSPAERLLAGRAAALSDAELIGVLMYGGRATGREEAVSAVFTRFGGLSDVFRADRREYAGLRGMEKTPALRLAAAAALHARLLAGPRDEKLRLVAAADIYDRYAAELRQAGGETALLLLLDAGNRVVRGILLDGALPSPADVLRPALREGAAKAAVMRNRSAGSPAPDAADLDFVRRLRAASDIIGLPLLDYVVAGENGYYSFAEAGALG